MTKAGCSRKCLDFRQSQAAASREGFLRETSAGVNQRMDQATGSCPENQKDVLGHIRVQPGSVWASGLIWEAQAPLEPGYIGLLCRSKGTFLKILSWRLAPSGSLGNVSPTHSSQALGVN